MIKCIQYYILLLIFFFLVMVIIVFKISSSTKPEVLNIWRFVINFSRYTPSNPSVFIEFIRLLQYM